MVSYIIRRLLVGFLIAFAVITSVFFTMHLAPGDPIDVMLPPGSGATTQMVEEVKQQYGLDQPIYIQYFKYLQKVAKLDFGKSYITNRSVGRTLLRRYPSTLKLAFASLLVSIIIGIPTGIISALRPNTIIDNFSRIIALIGISIPSFWLGLLLILSFSLRLGWLPSLGEGGSILTLTGLKHLFLPALTLGVGAGALVMRLTRSSMLEVLREDYLRTARAKGLYERAVIYRHALRNALIPVVTVLGLRFGALLGGAVVIETIFSWPGVGRYLIESITSHNFPAVQGAVLVMSVGFILLNLFIDIIYCWIDPMISYN